MQLTDVFPPLNSLIGPNASVLASQTFFSLFCLYCSRSLPRPNTTPTPTVHQRFLPAVFAPTYPVAPCSQHFFNASTLPVSSPSLYGPSPLSRPTPSVKISNPTPNRREISFVELPPSTPSGPGGDTSPYLHDPSPSIPYTTMESASEVGGPSHKSRLESAIAGARRKLHEQLIQETSLWPPVTCAQQFSHNATCNHFIQLK